MFYTIRAHTRLIALVTAGCLSGMVYPGKSEHIRHHATKRQIAKIQHLLTTAEQQHFTPQKKNVTSFLYEAVRKGDIASVQLILSSSRKKDIHLNKHYGFFKDTLLHSAVKKKNKSLVTLLLNDPRIDPSAKNISVGGRKTALDLAIASGSHNMIKTFISRGNFDPTQRDETGESTINKLARRNKFWAKKMCQNLLRNRLETEVAACQAASNPNDKKLECMICLQTAAEICQAAKINPLDVHKKPEQLMSITPCCPALLCTQDKKRWLNTSLNKNCPTCRKPLQEG